MCAWRRREEHEEEQDTDRCVCTWRREMKEIGRVENAWEKSLYINGEPDEEDDSRVKTIINRIYSTSSLCSCMPYVMTLYIEYNQQ